MKTRPLMEASAFGYQYLAKSFLPENRNSNKCITTNRKKGKEP